MEKPMFYSIQETAKILKISRITTQRRLREGQIPFIRIGRRVLIPASFFGGLAESAFMAGNASLQGQDQ